MKDLLKIIILSNALISIGFGNCDSDEVELWDECYSITNTTSLLRINEGLTGEIPSEIGQLTNLATLKLHYNELNTQTLGRNIYCPHICTTCNLYPFFLP